MLKHTSLVGKRIVRKRDGATGSVSDVSEVCTRGVAFPFKTLVHVRLDSTLLADAVGGDMVGDLGWFKSYFRVVNS